jgi:hypothetical protein
VLTISLRSETRQKLDQMAIAQGEAPGRAVTAAELAAAIVEHFVGGGQGA